MAEAARQSMSKAHYLADALCQLSGVSLKYQGPFFHEFVTVLPQADAVLAALEEAGILGGLPVEGACCGAPPKRSPKAELDRAAAIVKEVLAK